MTTIDSSHSNATPPGPQPTNPKVDSEDEVNNLASDSEGPDYKLRPERLINKAAASKRYSNFANLASEKLLRGGLKQLKHGQLEVVDQTGKTTRYGQLDPTDNNPLAARINIHDARAWTAAATNGSAGLGRGYIEGWWDSENPVAVVQVFIRNLVMLDKVRNGLAKFGRPITTIARKAAPNRNKTEDKENILSHYDIGNEFFELFLDETMTYSSGMFHSRNESMKQASLNKQNRLLDKLGVTEEHDVLEIGTGWGSFAIQAVQRNKCRVTTTTISDEQHDEAKKRFHANGVEDSVTLLNKDWRELEGNFDRVISIEMIEAVHWRDYKKFFSTIEATLKPDGLVGLQAICVSDKNYERIKKTDDFIRTFVFPGGFLPSIGVISKTLENTSLQIVDVETFPDHYAETLRRWRVSFNKQEAKLKEMGLDLNFRRLWDFYLAYCEAAFRERSCTVAQIVIAGPKWQPTDLTVRN